MMSVVEALQARGMVEALTSDEVKEATLSPVKVYCGFDPTSDCLHLGNLVPILGLRWFQNFGHTPVVLLGGATGRIGDPSGKSHERPLLDDAAIQHNLKGIETCLRQLLDFDHPTAAPILLDNYEWFKDIRFVDFLRDVGKHFRVGPMLGKESVRKRLQSDEGMSFTEFSYQLLQGYDFLYLHDHYGVSVQIGGSDQWGNMVAGTELVRKLRGTPVHALTLPLLVRSDGKKFGKSEQGAIWLLAEKLPPYDLYQYLYRVPDADVIPFLRILTFLDLGIIEEIQHAMQEPGYQAQSAQKRLAEEVVRFVHGSHALSEAQKVTEQAAPGSLATSLDPQTLDLLARQLPSAEVERQKVVGEKVVDVLIAAGAQGSKGEARRLVRNGGLYVNNERVTDENASFSREQLIDGRLILLGLGKKKKMILKVI